MHSSGTFVTIDKDGNISMQAVKRLTLHDRDGNVTVTADASTGDVSVNTKGKITFDAEGDGTVRSQSKIDIESPATTLKGGDVTINGTVTPTGTGALCGLPFFDYRRSDALVARPLLAALRLLVTPRPPNSGAAHTGSTAKQCQ